MNKPVSRTLILPLTAEPLAALLANGRSDIREGVIAATLFFIGFVGWRHSPDSMQLPVHPVHWSFRANGNLSSIEMAASLGKVGRVKANFSDLRRNEASMSVPQLA